MCKVLVNEYLYCIFIREGCGSNFIFLGVFNIHAWPAEPVDVGGLANAWERGDEAAAR